MCSTGAGLEDAVAGLAAAPVSTLPVAGLQELIARTSSAAARLEGIGSRALGELQVRAGGTVPASAFEAVDVSSLQVSADSGASRTSRCRSVGPWRVHC